MNIEHEYLVNKGFKMDEHTKGRITFSVVGNGFKLSFHYDSGSYGIFTSDNYTFNKMLKFIHSDRRHKLRYGFNVSPEDFRDFKKDK